MENLSRRDFMQSATVFAAGAAVGIPAYKGRKEHGPVDLRMYFLSAEYGLKVVLSSDEAKDLFKIIVLPLDAGDKPGEARLSLSKVRAVVSSRSSKEIVRTVCKSSDGQVETRMIALGMIRGDLVLREHGVEGLPFHLDVQDVHRVL